MPVILVYLNIRFPKSNLFSLASSHVDPRHSLNEDILSFLMIQLQWRYLVNTNYARDMFQLQSELIDTKVDMAVSKANDRVIEKINDLRHEIHDRFNSLDKRVVAIETKLGMVTEAKKGVSSRILDYAFKAGWGFLTLLFAYLIVQLHLFMA